MKTKKHHKVLDDPALNETIRMIEEATDLSFEDPQVEIDNTKTGYVTIRFSVKTAKGFEVFQANLSRGGLGGDRGWQVGGMTHTGFANLSELFKVAQAE